MRLPFTPSALAHALGAALSLYVHAAFSETAAGDTLPEVSVNAKSSSGDQMPSEKTKSYTTNSTASATRLDTTLKETPQSISVITRSVMDDFKLNTINDVLDMSTGVKVERAETDRIYYTARGSDISNFQIDGIGVPFPDGLQQGDVDTAVYDRIEVLRGANGLLSGTGNPSATINFIRKRPTSEFQLNVNATVGSWASRRLDMDVSGPLNDAGTLRGRLVLANQNRDSYLDRYSQERNVAYGIIEADLSDKTKLAFGHTYQANDTNGPMYGTLRLLYADGSRRPYDRSDSTAAPWSYWNNLTNTTFVELTHFFDNGWKIKTQLTRKELDADAKLLFVAGAQDRNTGLGLTGSRYGYRDVYKEIIGDAYLSGPFSLGGRQHEVVLGSNWSRSAYSETQTIAAEGTILYNSFDDIATTPAPTWLAAPPPGGSSYAIKRLNSYAAAKFNVSDQLKVTVGANMLSYDYTGSGYGTDRKAEATNKVTPYIGAVFALNPLHSLYASYTEIYNPQTNLSRQLQPLPPLQGKNYEAGIKSEWFSNLNTTFAVFRTDQKGVATSDGTVALPGGGVVGVFNGIDAITKGYEFDIAGEVTSNLRVSGGYTRLASIKNEEGDNVKPYTPRQMLRLSAIYKVPYLEKLKVGASVNWQDETHADVVGFNTRVRQSSYALLNLLASYEINPHWNASVNVYNVTNEKYLTSLMFANFNQGYYGPPVNASATLSWKF